MCGIAGFAGFNSPGLLARMCQSILHRGPDSDGMIELPDSNMSIGMRRLAIIDIDHGQQPFSSPDRRVHLVFNGEIYNHDSLRDELRRLGHGFTTRSDTEVVLHAWLEWGPQAWDRLHGMFAVAIIDLRQNPRLIVARDRVGIKPLYYAMANGRFIFASEIKALLEWPDLDRTVDLRAIRDYMALRYVPGPRSLFRQVRKLPAGHQMVFENAQLHLQRWWSPPAPGLQNRSMTFEEAVADFGAAMRQSVRRHMISDVPVGAFLSGGIDSNLIVALMSEVSSAPVRTFSIGFPDFPDNDRKRAAITARALGTQHTALDCRAEDMANLRDIAWKLDEPVGDAIIVPMYVLAREARRQVKVVLSGEGADEMLGGYEFHRKLRQIAGLRRFVPPVAWQAGAAVAEAMPSSLLGLAFDYPGKLGDAGRRKVARLLRGCADAGLTDLYRSAISLFDPDDIAEASICDDLTAAALHPVGEDRPASYGGTALQDLILAQYDDWLPDDILMKLDKMTMAHSLEGRVPFLDDAVIQSAARIPDHHKIGGDTNKRVMRAFAADLLPPEVVTAPKQAFYLPLESYIDTPETRDIVRAALDPGRLRKRGLFSPDWVRQQMEAPRDAGFLPLKRAFSLVMLELWFERFAPDASWA